MRPLLSLLALTAALPCPAFDFDRDPLLEPSSHVVFVAGTEGYAAFRAPALACTTNGTLIAIAQGHRANANDDGDIDIVCTRSTDAGTNWGPLRVIHDAGTEPLLQPGATLDRKTDRLWLTFSQGPGPVLLTHSDDAGETWAKPRAITPEDPPFPKCPDASTLRLDGVDRLKRQLAISASKADVLSARLQYETPASDPIEKPIWPGPSGRAALALLPRVALGCLFECGDAKPDERIAFSRFNLHWLETISSTTLPPAGLSLFDGKSMGRWLKGDFRGQEASVTLKDGAIVMEMGNDMTGITWGGPVTRMDYELCFEAQRVDGSDFFCGLTFPVGENPCTLVLGGWGGSLVGLSCLDYEDAANNETGMSFNFENGKWYNVRLRVTKSAIEAWIDGEQVIDVETTNRRLGIRFEVEPSRPLGIATWRTTGAVRDVRLFPVTPIE